MGNQIVPEAIYSQPKALDENYLKLHNIYQKHKNVKFMNRLINRENYPMIRNPDGSYSTHRMAWSESEGKYYVFPTMEMIGEELIDLPSAGIDPFEHAMQNKNFIEFSTAEEADWFSQNYKKYLGIQ